MSYLSISIGELQARYDVVVVGSGYGGGVAALRMIEAEGRDGRRPSVCVLERGREWKAGEFPASLTGALRQLQFDSPGLRLGRRTGLFDLHYDRDIAVLVGCGLGGTSLINANVMIEPTAAVLNDDAWPEAIRNSRAEMARLYADAKTTLSAAECAEKVFVFKRDHLFEAGEPPTRVRPALAVSFSDGRNAQAVPRRHCTMCGDCVTGCNHGAKNTTDRNYLARARELGAEIYCNVSVRSVEPVEEGWLVHVRIVDRAWERFRSPDIVLRAGTVFLAAGTLGSTEILLRSRERHGLSLSPQLGARFSGNGDVIAFSYNGRDKVQAFGYGAMVPEDSSVGPTITGMLDERDVKDGPQLTIQDAAVPGALAPIIRFAGPLIARRTRLANPSRDFSFKQLRAELASLFQGVQHGAVARTQAFLVMSRDGADGQLKLSNSGRLRVSWPGVGTRPLFREIHARLARLTKTMGGRFVANPMWMGSRRRLLSVHPLGGCPMGKNARAGVVNDLGQVFASNPPHESGARQQIVADDQGESIYRGLYVSDGAIVPTALGTNPALTITALAERIAARAKDQVPADVPRRKLPAASDFSVPGIQYAERLTGSARVRGHDTRLELVLHISADNLEKLLSDARHEARIIGRARTPDLPCEPERGLDRHWTVTNGFLNVLVEDPRHPCTRLMVYRLELVSPRGASMFLRGHKTINLETCRRSTWRAISSFAFAFHENAGFHELGPPPQDTDSAPDYANERGSLQIGRPFGDACDWVGANTGSPACSRCQVWKEIECIGTGRVRNLFPDALRLAASIEITKEPRFMRRLALMTRFVWSFTDAVIEARVWALQRTKRPDPFTRPILRVPDEVDHIEDQRLQVAGVPRYRLTTYSANGGRPPVIVGPGFGMSSEAFHAGYPSFVSFLETRGYQVWLLDYRGSDKLAISLTQFTLDELVADFKEAIEELHRKLNRPVRILGHCVASLVTTMLLLKHGDLGGKIHSVVLSQSFAFIDHPLINRIKAGIRLPQILRTAGFIPMLTVDDDLRSDWRSRLLDRALRFYPTAERCDSAVCRRILFMYGEVVRHARLNEHTHDLMYDFFDRANLTAFVHLSRMIRAGHIVDRFGRDEYLTRENGARIQIPVTLVQGMKNRLFRPAGGHRTLRWLHEHGADGGARAKSLFTLVPVKDYGHLDNFVGTHAACEVFDLLGQAVDREAPDVEVVSP